MDLLFDEISFVLRRIGEVVDPSRLLLVGARCRDIHQYRLIKQPAARTTRDIDLAFAVESWEEFERLKRAFPTPQRGWQSICVEGILVDVIPFGGIEDPPGKVTSSDSFRLNVSGIKEVFEAAQPYRIGGGEAVLLPTVPGFAAMKLHAWLDRNGSGVFKDATDLALVFTWYEEAEGAQERLWSECEDKGPDEFLGDERAMAAFLLGFDVGEELGEIEAKLLLKRLSNEGAKGRRLLADKLATLPGSSLPLTEREVQVEAMHKGLLAACEAQESPRGGSS